jgi:hypothetical protein
METLVRVVAPHFVAGLIVRDGYCIRAAPILRRMIGWSSDQIREYFRQKGWRATVVTSEGRADDRRTYRPRM